MLAYFVHNDVCVALKKNNWFDFFAWYGEGFVLLGWGVDVLVYVLDRNVVCVMYGGVPPY
jgi:hypothetical protein